MCGLLLFFVAVSYSYCSSIVCGLLLYYCVRRRFCERDGGGVFCYIMLIIDRRVSCDLSTRERRS